MSHAVDGGTKNEVFESGVTVRSHDDEVGLKFACGADDLGSRISAGDDADFGLEAVALQGGTDSLKIFLARLDFGGRGERAKELARRVLFDVKQEDSGIAL